VEFASRAFAHFVRLGVIVVAQSCHALSVPEHDDNLFIYLKRLCRQQQTLCQPLNYHSPYAARGIPVFAANCAAAPAVLLLHVRD